MSERDESAGVERVEQLIAQGALADARETLDALLAREPDDWRLWRLSAGLAERQHLDEQALLDYERALSLDPREAGLHAALAQVLLRLGAYEAGLEHLDAARAFAPDDPAHTLVLIEYYLLRGERAQAMSYLKEALGQDPSAPRVFALLGQALWYFGRWPEARAALLQSIELDPGEVARTALLRMALARGEHALALPLLLEPAHEAEGLYWQGWGHYWQGDLAQAREFWRAALLSAPAGPALLSLSLAAPLVSQTSEERRNWAGLIRQALPLLEGVRLEALQPQWPLAAAMPEDAPALLSEIGDLFARSLDALAQAVEVDEAESKQPEVPAAEQLAPYRVGLIASDLGRPELQDWLEQFLRLSAHKDLDWQLFYLHPGELPAALQPWAARFVQLPDHGEALVRMLADFGLAALLYLDLGASLYYAALRAPVPLQVLLPTWGETSGLRSLQAVASGPQTQPGPWREPGWDLPAEPLLALPRSGEASRADWELPRLGHLYLCPVTPEAWLPEFDTVLAELLNLDRKAFVLGLKLPGSSLHTRVMQRHEQSLGDRAHRMRWLELAPERLPALIGVVDLLLEPTEAGAPWACFWALTQGVPALGCPGQSLRSRLSATWRAELDLPELSVATPAELAARAVHLVTDRTARAMLKERLLAGRERLCDQRGRVAALEARLCAELRHQSHHKG